MGKLRQWGKEISTCWESLPPFYNAAPRRDDKNRVCATHARFFIRRDRVLLVKLSAPFLSDRAIGATECVEARGPFVHTRLHSTCLCFLLYLYLLLFLVFIV